MVWEDPYISYALRDCVDWGFKIKLFLRIDGVFRIDHGEEHEGQKLKLLQDFLKKVVDFKLIQTEGQGLVFLKKACFPIQDISAVWNKKRNDGRYGDLVPSLSRSLKHPTPWPKELVTEFRKIIAQCVVVPIQSRGIYFLEKSLMITSVKFLSSFGCLLFFKIFS